VGDFAVWKFKKAVHGIGIVHSSRAWNLPSDLDGAAIFTKAAAVGCVLLPRLSTGTGGAGHFR
jgi:hypothetical protein